MKPPLIPVIVKSDSWFVMTVVVGWVAGAGCSPEVTMLVSFIVTELCNGPVKGLQYVSKSFDTFVQLLIHVMSWGRTEGVPRFYIFGEDSASAYVLHHQTSTVCMGTGFLVVIHVLCLEKIIHEICDYLLKNAPKSLRLEQKKIESIVL